MLTMKALGLLGKASMAIATVIGKCVSKVVKTAMNIVNNKKVEKQEEPISEETIEKTKSVVSITISIVAFIAIVFLATRISYVQAAIRILLAIDSILVIVKAVKLFVDFQYKISF